ncbi:MAG: hypothetical protein IPM77_07880 [Crocinitomicaceae bacterium]|nr:hypothetical protein [Crocinitomicaceae bacterium]
MKDFIDFKKVSVELLENEILCTHYKNGFTITEADAREIDDAQLLMCAEKEVGMLVDLYDIDNKISKEAKEFFTKKGKMLAYTKAVAIVQKEKQDNLPGGFFSSFIKPIYPVRTLNRNNWH